MNMRAAVIHLAGDIIQSVGVVIASIIIYIKPEWSIADPICTFIFTFLVLFTTIPIFKDCIIVLMEASPKEIDVAKCY
jgi:cation diffusion facilitator family transporter